MTYRVFPALAASNPAGGMDMSYCDPAGLEAGPLTNASCNPGCVATALPNCTPPLHFLSGKGLLVKNISGAAVMDPNAATPSGAAYVVVSTGESGGGAMLNTGQVSTSTTTEGTEEQRNYVSAAYAPGYYYVDDSLSEATDPAKHFDDIVSRPTLLTVINKAALGPRSH